MAASRSYVGMKSATTKQSGLSSLVEEFPSKITAAEMYEKLGPMERGQIDIHIDVPAPLPAARPGKTINTTTLCNRIDISKDGDGLNQVTLGLMSLGAERYYDCCTPSGMLDLASVYMVREKGARLRPDGIASFARAGSPGGRKKRHRRGTAFQYFKSVSMLRF